MTPMELFRKLFMFEPSVDDYQAITITYQEFEQIRAELLALKKYMPKDSKKEIKDEITTDPVNVYGHWGP